MALGDNPITPLFEPGTRVTCATATAIGAGKFVVPTGIQGTGSPLLTPATPLTKGNNITVAIPAAGAKPFGVTAYDTAAADDAVDVIAGGGCIVPMVTGTGGLTAGQEVQTDAAGLAIVLAAGRPAGLCVIGGTVGLVAYVKLYD